MDDNPKRFLKSPPRSPELSVAIPSIGISSPPLGPQSPQSAPEISQSSHTSSTSDTGDDVRDVMEVVKEKKGVLEERIRVLEMSHKTNSGMVEAMCRLHNEELCEVAHGWQISEEESFRRLGLARHIVDTERRQRSVSDALRSAFPPHPPSHPPAPPLDPEGIRIWTEDVSTRCHALTLDIQHNVLLLQSLERNVSVSQRRQKARKVAEVKATLKAQGADLTNSNIMLGQLRYAANVLVSNDISPKRYVTSMPHSPRKPTNPLPRASSPLNHRSISPPRDRTNEPVFAEPGRSPIGREVEEEGEEEEGLEVDGIRFSLAQTRAHLEEELRGIRRRMEVEGGEVAGERSGSEEVGGSGRDGVLAERAQKRRAHLVREEARLVAALHQVRESEQALDVSC